jgi:hypothetical protein
MNAKGPPLEALLHRLAECPPEFLEEPLSGATGRINVTAVVSDLLRDLGGGAQIESRLFIAPAVAASKASSGSPIGSPARNRLRVILIACWLLHDGWFRKEQKFAGAAAELLARGLNRLAEVIDAPRFVTDPDRREELVRFILAQLGLRPAAETVAQAQDRLTTLDSIELRRVIQETRAAEQRAREIREALARKAAEEAAAKVTRE